MNPMQDNDVKIFVKFPWKDAVSMTLIKNAILNNMKFGEQNILA